MKKYAYLFGVAAAALATGGGAYAQTAAQSTEIVVTAQRRAQNIQDVPIAVTAFSARQLEAAQIEDTVDLVRFTPSVTGGLNTGTGSALTFFIRGLGSTEQVATFDVPVATYVDEIYFARQSANAVSLFDIERVEVLRGPQGTLFGRNTTGGAVSIITRKPAEEFGGFIEGSYGSFDRYQARATLDLPVNDQVLTKFSGFYVEDDGYGRNVRTGERINGEEAYGVRGALRFLPTENITWDVALDYIDQQKTTVGSSPVDDEYISRSGLRSTECDDDIRERYLAQAVGNCARVRTGGVTSNLAVDTEWATVNFITGYRSIEQQFALDFFNGNNLFAPANFAGAYGGYVLVNDVTNQQFTQEIKLAGEAPGLEWVAGVFYLTEETKTAEVDSAGGAPSSRTVLADWILDNSTTSLAFYAQGDFALDEKFTLTLGGRYTEEEKSLSFASGPLGTSATAPTTARVVARGIPVEQEKAKFTPRVALTYEFNDDALVFLSATNGFKSGGWNTRVTNVNNVTIFGPEDSWSYELGTRTSWFEDRLRANATFYFQNVEDLQLLSGTGAGTTTFVTRNAGELESYGLEVELSAMVTDQLDMFLNAAFSDKEYKNLLPANGGAGASAGTIPCGPTSDPPNCVTINDDPVRYPDVTAALGASYEIPLQSFGSLTLNGAVNYSSPYWTSTYNDTGFSTGVPFGGSFAIRRPLSYVPPTTLLNVGAVYRSPDERWEAAVECSNCTAEYYATSSLFGLGYYNDPRRVTFRVRYTY